KAQPVNGVDVTPWFDQFLVGSKFDDAKRIRFTHDHKPLAVGRENETVASIRHAAADIVRVVLPAVAAKAAAYLIRLKINLTAIGIRGGFDKQFFSVGREDQAA